MSELERARLIAAHLEGELFLLEQLIRQQYDDAVAIADRLERVSGGADGEQWWLVAARLQIILNDFRKATS